MNYDMKKCGERIRQLRVQNGFTQEKMADSLNIDQSYYGRVENGKKGCSVDLFIQLSEVFGVSLDYLILGRYPSDRPERMDVALLKSSVDGLIYQMERFKESL